MIARLHIAAMSVPMEEEQPLIRAILIFWSNCLEANMNVTMLIKVTASLDCYKLSKMQSSKLIQEVMFELTDR